MKRTISILLMACVLSVLPLQFEGGQGLSYPQAHAFIGRLMLKAVKFEASIMLKNWLKNVSKKEGKRVALAALTSLKALPQDADFRLAMVVALAGGSYAQARVLTQQRSLDLMQEGAEKQWRSDTQRLADHPEIAFHSFGQSAGDTVEEQWNTADDQLTCGAHNKNIQFKAVQADTPFGEHQYTVVDTPNENLLTGRALIQRLLFKRLMRNSTFQDQQQAQQTAGFYAHLACATGKSRKVTAFMGGIALHGKDKLMRLEDVRNKTLLFINKINQWAKQKL